MNSSISNQNKMIKNYLNQQMDNVFIENILSPDNIQLHHSVNNHQLKQSNTSTTNSNDEQSENLDEFKEYVKYYMNLDNEIKDINKKIKLLDVERKRRKLIIETLTPKIMKYMQINDIEELNSKDGALKYRQVFVKEPLSQKQIKTKLYEQFQSNDDIKSTLDDIFHNRGKIKKESLKRLTY